MVLFECSRCCCSLLPLTSESSLLDGVEPTDDAAFANGMQSTMMIDVMDDGAAETSVDWKPRRAELRAGRSSRSSSVKASVTRDPASLSLQAIILLWPTVLSTSHDQI
jgi:hypothetical protein